MTEELGRLAVLVPAYKPDELVIKLATELLTEGYREILVVDDGSGAAFAAIFTQLAQMGCRVLTHPVNGGKGRAIKTGLRDLLDRGLPVEGVVTADADGQHLVKDIGKVGRALLEQRDSIVLGMRVFSGQVPFKSRAGNAITRGVFNFVSGQRIHDTQTGLRGVPASAFADLVCLSGDRYEYEINVLLEASRLSLTLVEVGIETVYLDDNSRSHFNAFKDSWRIYRLLLLFGASSLLAFGVDFFLFWLISVLWPGVLWAAVVGARLVSSFVNFMVNRAVIFSKKGQRGRFHHHVIGYYALAVFILAANYGLIRLFSGLGLNLYLAKAITEVLLFFVSYSVQKRFVFR